jgi:hypothetical protein
VGLYVRLQKCYLHQVPGKEGRLVGSCANRSPLPPPLRIPRGPKQFRQWPLRISGDDQVHV